VIHKGHHSAEFRLDPAAAYLGDKGDTTGSDGFIMSGSMGVSTIWLFNIAMENPPIFNR